MHTTREQHTLTAPASTFDGSFIEADSTLKAPAPKHSMQPEVQGNLQTQSKHLLPTNHTHSTQTADTPTPPPAYRSGGVGIDFPAKSPSHQLQKLHLHVAPFQVFINRLKVIRFCDDLMSSGRLFHNLAPSYLKLLRPYVV